MTRLVLDARGSSRFELLAPLGRGGFGSVHEARDVHSGQLVALKELGQASGDNLARFKQEFRALSGLHHPNLVGLRELFEQSGRWFIVMELIDGADFISYVRMEYGRDNNNGREYDEGRLRQALAGIAQGLCALHEFGVLHRDLKPSNVCVTREGRAVLLDFGLVTSIDPTRQSTNGMGVGTVAYMAPEQGVGNKLGPPADWYALGVCLFEALTDRLPFEGNSGFQLLLQKQQAAAPPASRYARNLPADLEELCARLLDREPERRPTGGQVLAALGVQAALSVRASLPAHAALSTNQGSTFAGREVEIENLERALARTNDGEFRLVLVEGESGVGKSELVSEFLRGVRMRHPSLLALPGRCYENEQLPYKAFDGCIDELAKYLRKLPEDECRALLPPRAAVLSQLFPVLNHVPGIAKARKDQLSADPTARRLEAFAALAQLLGKLAEDRPVVLVIDDLQWADAESFRLLKALVESRERPPLLIVATVRPREELDAELLAQMERVRAWQCTDVQLLYGLPASQAEALAVSLLGPLAKPNWIRSITEESRGHPLFLSELVHFAQSRELGAGAVITLDAALRARIERLSKTSRELLELVAVAARPYGYQVFARAVPSSEVERNAQPLLQAKLLRVRKGTELGCFHDRIRHVAVSLIARTRLPYLHRQLATALAAEDSVDRAELARHWDLAGDSEHASQAYEEAAGNAMNALAFARAAELSERALSLLGETLDERYVKLLVQRATALACSGRSAQAASLYARAADLSGGDARLRLRGSVANQLMLSAQIAPGLHAARELLNELDVALPLETGKALMRFLWERVRHALFARFAQPREEERARRRLAVELISTLNRSIGFVHPPAYLALTAQYVRLAASLGDEAQLACAYAAQGYLDTLRGSIKKGALLFERARRICERLAQPRLNAWQTLLEGTARLVGWDVLGGQACLLRAQDLLQAHCPDQPRELTQARIQLGAIWYLTGEHARLANESERWIAEARERDDNLGVALLLGVGYGFLRHLMRDAQDDAVAELQQAAASLPAEPFGFAQLGHMMGMVVAYNYQRGSGGLRWLDARKELHARPFLLKTPFGRETFLVCTLFATLHASRVASERELDRLLARARKQAIALGKRRIGIGYAFSQIALAQMEALSGNLERARAHLHETRKHLPGAESAIGHQCLFLEGVLEGSDTGQRKCDAARAFFREQGWKSPDQGLALYLPLIDRLGARMAPKRAKTLLLDRFQVLNQLGGGGFGNVVEARDTETGERIALKEFLGSGAKPLERFKQEFRALQGVHHANLVRLHALFEHEGAWYIAMELVEGIDLISYVRESDACDLARLRTCFTQLARALASLHEAGFIHRDLTPANVRVSAEGRPVLLDFGLIGRVDESAGSELLGTAEYAAPEQLEGARPDPSADVYALGVCMYEGLTGAPPFSGETPATLLAEKRRGPPALAQNVNGPELSLALRMLAPDPTQRPLLSEVMVGLAEERSSAARDAAVMSKPAPQAMNFWGRQEELDVLARALERAASGALSVVVLQGESGLGKSALVSEFAQRAQADRANALVLTSRCYENEQVGLKAFDGAVDQLAHVLARLPQYECEELLPRRAGLLAQLFPVLSQVPAIAGAGKKGIPADPAARRLAAQQCFIDFLRQLSGRFPLVLVIDDLQWADQESFRMLRLLLAQARELPLLVVCTARPTSELEGAAATELTQLLALESTRTVALSGLSGAAANELAQQLVAEAAPAELLDKLVQESKGHPLFLRELIERAKVGTFSQTAPSLDEAIRTRVERLTPEARALIDLVALGGRPYRMHWLARALGEKTLARDALTSLLTQGLVRTRGEGELTCYHDRIREVTVQLFAPSKRQRLARKLAEALEQDPAVDAAERARLWDMADDAERAIRAYEQAGDRALEGLSFARATEIYARALTLLAGQRDERFVRLSMQRGQALVRMGKSAEAARVFQAAAEFAPPELRGRLRIWGAQHLILGAQVEEGLRAASVLLRELGLPLANTDGQAMLRIGVERARIALRGSKLRAKPEPLSSAQRLVLEALHGLSSPVRAVSYLPGSVLVIQYLRRALLAGDTVHTARALAYEALWRAVSAPKSDHLGMFAESRELADRAGEDAIVAEVELMRGLGCLARCEFKKAPEHIGFAHELLQSRCPGQPWLLTAARMYLGSAWTYLGDYRALAQHGEAWVSEARDKEDQYALLALSGFGGASLRHLLSDRPEAAISELDGALVPWSGAPFATNQVGAMFSKATVLAYMEARDYPAWVRECAARHGREFLLRTPVFQTSHLSTQVFAALSEAADAKPDVQKPLFAHAERKARALAKVRNLLAPGISELCLGWITAYQGRHEQAIAHARRARQVLADTAMARWAFLLEGMVEGGEAGRAKCETIRAEVVAQGFTNPERALNFMFPRPRLFTARTWP